MSRGANMRAIRSTGMKPEMVVRKLVHGLGYRYRLHRADLPGRPDLVFTSRMKIIFVHGCFWHRHGCKLTHLPKTNLSYWQPKLARNIARDTVNLQRLTMLGWRSLVVWECQLKDSVVYSRKTKSF